MWIAHFRQRDGALAGLRQSDLVLIHPLILGEIACGTPPSRAQTLRDLAHLQQARQAGLQETLDFVERQRLFGLACTLISPDAAL